MTITKYSFTTEQLSVNVLNEFVNMTPEQVREATEKGRSPLVNVCINLTHDFNKASVVRASNAFLCDSVYLVGRRRFDKRGTVGLHHYENIFHADTLQEVVEKLHNDGYTVFAVDNVLECDPKPVYDVALPKKTAFVYGEEQNGLGMEEISMCDGMLYIPQRGVARSLNIAQAAAVMMSEYCRQWSF